jgi:magnesium chelatase subunit I
MDRLKSGDRENPYHDLVEWFGKGRSIEMLSDFTDAEYRKALDEIGPLKGLVKKHAHGLDEGSQYFLMEMVLWALAEHSKLNKERIVNGFNFSDLFSTYLRGGEIDLDMN